MLRKTILVVIVILPPALWASAAVSDDCGYKADGKYHCGTDCGYKADGNFHCGTNCGYKSDGQFHCEGEG
jgi:hypothetical protein